MDHGSSVVRLKHMYGAHAIEHGSSRSSRWLRERRLRITLWTAAVEGLLYLVHVLHWWEAVVLAALAVGLWWMGGRPLRTLEEALTRRERGLRQSMLALLRDRRGRFSTEAGAGQ